MLKYLPQIILFLIFGLFVLIILMGDSGYLSYRATEAKYEDLLSEVNKLAEENLVLKKEIDLLKNDQNYQEYIIRREMNLIKSNEILLIFEKIQE